jgi:hypothetical protein
MEARMLFILPKKQEPVREVVLNPFQLRDVYRKSRPASLPLPSPPCPLKSSPTAWCGPTPSSFLPDTELLECDLESRCLPPARSRVFPAASWSSFEVAGLLLRSLIHSGLTLVWGEHLVKGLPFLHRVLCCKWGVRGSRERRCGPSNQGTT